MIGSLILLTLMATTEQNPIVFRCDAMEVTQNPARSRCQGNAIASQENILICCDAFVTKADTNWQWKTLHCVGDVRAQRGGELAWAQEAIFQIENGSLTLKGMPVLQRGKSLMQGKEIIIEQESNKARIIKPQGIMHHDPEKLVSTQLISKKLPTQCPLPSRPKKVIQ